MTFYIITHRVSYLYTIWKQHGTIIFSIKFSFDGASTSGWLHNFLYMKFLRPKNSCLYEFLSVPIEDTRSLYAMLTSNITDFMICSEHKQFLCYAIKKRLTWAPFFFSVEVFCRYTYWKRLCPSFAMQT